MARYHLQIQVPANSQVYIYVPGTTTLVNEPIYADRSSGATLSNPFTVAGTKTDIFLGKAETVSVGIKSPSAAAPVTVQALVSEPVVSHGTLKSIDGKVVAWFTY